MINAELRQRKGAGRLCLFIDDLPPDFEATCACGWHGIAVQCGLDLVNILQQHSDRPFKDSLMSSLRIRVNQNQSDQATPECLVELRIPQLRRYLSRRSENFSPWVIELAIDRVVRAALPYLDGTRNERLTDAKSRRRWIFKSALKAAKQVASRQFPCDVLEPSKLETVMNRGLFDEGVNERDAALYAAIDLLTPLQREAIDWCVIRGLSIQEAAAKMKHEDGRPRGASTVKYHLHAGLERLKSILKNTFVH